MFQSKWKTVAAQRQQNNTCQILEPLLGQISHQALVAVLPNEIWPSQAWNRQKYNKPCQWNELWSNKWNTFGIWKIMTIQWIISIKPQATISRKSSRMGVLRFIYLDTIENQKDVCRNRSLSRIFDTGWKKYANKFFKSSCFGKQNWL